MKLPQEKKRIINKLKNNFQHYLENQSIGNRDARFSLPIPETLYCEKTNDSNSKRTFKC